MRLKDWLLQANFKSCICFLVLLLHREIMGYVERAEGTPGLSSKGLLCQILCSCLWCVLNLCIASSLSALAPSPFTQPLAPSLFPETRALQREPQPHLGMRSAQAPSLTLHLLPGPGVSAAAANRSTEQLHRRLLLDATRSGKGSEIEGSKAVSSCSTKTSRRAQGHMLCSLHV